MQINGFITDLNDDKLTIKLSDLEDNERYLINNAMGSQSTIYFDDGRTISVDQRKKIFAMFNEIADFLGYTPTNIEEILKIRFIERMDMPAWFSFSNCSIELAKQFLDFEINFCIDNRIPFKTKLFDEIQQSYGTRVNLLKHRICFVCGKEHADVDHVDTIGSGRNRRETNQIGMRVWTLCRYHHQCRHKQGVKTFAQTNQIKPVKLTPELIKYLNLANERANNE